MKAHPTELPDVVLLEPQVFQDERGVAFESYNRRVFRELIGLDVDFVQDNRSRSRKNVIRGLHYQVVRPQGKLVSAWQGEVFDVVIDLRRSSPTFKRWTGFTLSGQTRLIAWIPPGFAHGFAVLSQSAEVMYKLSDFWAPEHERTILWNDPELNITWPIDDKPVLSARDAQGLPLKSAELFP